MLEKIEIAPNTPEWYEYRKEGIGCSDIPVLTGQSDYSNPVKLFEQKIGLYPVQSPDSELTIWGHIEEPTILNIWQYWDARDKLAYIENYKSGKIQRRMKRNTGFLYVNSDFPFLFFTPDGVLPAGEKRLDGEVNEKDAPINAKNINHMVYNMYGGISPSIIEQMHGEMIVMGTDYAEIPHLVGGCQFHVDQCPYSQTVATSILEICKKFWFDRVVPAKPLAKRYLTETRQREKDAIRKDIYALEPPPDDKESYRDFLVERFVNRDIKVEASPEMRSLMHTYENLQQYGKEIDRNKRLISNLLLKYHEHNGVSRIVGEDCFSSFSKRHTIKGDVANPTGKKIAHQILSKLQTI